MLSKQTHEGYVAFQEFLQNGDTQDCENPYPPATLENRNWQFGVDIACDANLPSKAKPPTPEDSGNCHC